MRNIFSSLNRYAYRQDENFLTEAFAYLIELILLREPEYGSTLVQNICGLELEDMGIDTKIQTQITFEEGKPDLIISRGDSIAFIEIKLDSHLGFAQLERYYSTLSALDYKKKKLVLLTRSKHSIQETSLANQEFHHICWYQISGWLSENEFEDEVTDYQVKNFLAFLGEKDLSMEKVEWEYMRGVPAMRNLGIMIGTALAEAFPEEAVRKTAGWSWMGYYFNEDLFTGFRYDDPLKVVVENDGGTNPSISIELDLEEKHFFALRSGEQLELLTKFILESVETTAKG